MKGAVWHVSSKRPLRVWDTDEGVAERIRREQCFPYKGPLIFDCLHPPCCIQCTGLSGLKLNWRTSKGDPSIGRIDDRWHNMGYSRMNLMEAERAKHSGFFTIIIWWWLLSPLSTGFVFLLLFDQKGILGIYWCFSFSPLHQCAHCHLHPSIVKRSFGQKSH